ncbi:tumor susceptibility protein [Anaeramoeba flamelloides]|uniref:Tumor susceptibility protein n=1 Tax=Anaeramoeba flamelloides TaxID=1746091 RepID=A0ABQ8XR83_9EUKA|nr:tumor susceptibility protein [Anaeramoeba flamelloides]
MVENYVSLIGEIVLKQPNYNVRVPIGIYLFFSYPQQAPAVYILPQQGIHTINTGNPFIKGRSMIEIPYITNWKPTDHTLANLIQNLINLFSRNPPIVVVKKENSLHNYNQNNNFQQTKTMTTTKPKTKKELLIEKIKKRLIGLNEENEKIIEELSSEQLQLEKNQESISSGIQSLQLQTNTYNILSENVENQDKILSEWLETNKSQSLDNINVAEILIPIDILSKQMLELSAKGLAIDDTIYYLNKLLQNGTISTSDYLKKTRSLSAEEFITIELAGKVYRTQQQALSILY